MTNPPAFPTSLPEFQRKFPDDAACAEYLERIRWPDGFECPYCETQGVPYRVATRPWVLECRACRRQTSLIVGTVMERTHTPLVTWFWGAYLVTSQTPGMSALQFQRQLGLTRYETAFQILHKLRAGLVRPDRDMIGQEWPVELDETYIYPFNAFNSVLGIATHVAGPTYEELYSGTWVHPNPVQSTVRR